MLMGLKPVKTQQRFAVKVKEGDTENFQLMKICPVPQTATDSGGKGTVSFLVTSAEYVRVEDPIKRPLVQRHFGLN